MRIINGIVCLGNKTLYIHHSTEIAEYLDLDRVSFSNHSSTQTHELDVNGASHICFKVTNGLLIGVIVSTNNDILGIETKVSPILDNICNSIQYQFNISHANQSSYLPIYIFQIRCYKIFSDHFRVFKYPCCKPCVHMKYQNQFKKDDDYIALTELQIAHNDNAEEKQHYNTNRSLETVTHHKVSSHTKATYSCKVCMLGDAATGKDQLLHQFTTDKAFESEYKATIGAQFVTRNIEIDNTIIKLEIWNTAGDERFKSLLPMYLRGAAYVILCYDISNRATFESVDQWIQFIKECRFEAGIILVGNKLDLYNQRAVTTVEGEAKAQQLDIQFIETSAKNNVNVDSVFSIAAEYTYTHRQKHEYGVNALLICEDDYDSSHKKAAFMMGPDLSIPEMDKAETDRNSTLIDNVFADLENMFYIMAFMIYPCHCFNFCIFDNIMGCICCICFNCCQKLFIFLIFYPLIIIMSLVMVLPSCIFLLIVRASKIETDIKDVHIRYHILSQETCWKRFLRVIMQMIRSLFMFSLIALYPVMITYVIIPRYSNSEYIVTSCIASYLCMILLLQIFGTYRGLKSFAKRRNELFLQKDKVQKLTFVPKTFQINIGSLIGIGFILYEIFQLTLFANYVITSNSTNHPSQSVQTQYDAINKLTNLCYFSLNFVESHKFEFYVYFGFISVCALLLIFVMRYIYELNIYAIEKYHYKNDGSARDFYFHSFVGTIIYGHGSLQNVNAFICKIVSLLSDTLFLVILEKLLMILLCKYTSTNESYLVIDDTVQCWVGIHKLYATICLILIGYYIPICSMLAPMFDELNTDKNQYNETSKKFFSFTNTTQFVKPFLSAITLSKCFSLIIAQYIARGNALVTIVSQSVSMLILLIFTLYWTFSNLNMYGLTYNEPGFPFSVSMLRCIGFFGGCTGCVVQFLLYSEVITNLNANFILLIALCIGSLTILITTTIYHLKFSRFYKATENLNATIKYDLRQFKIGFD